MNTLITGLEKTICFFEKNRIEKIILKSERLIAGLIILMLITAIVVRTKAIDKANAISSTISKKTSIYDEGYPIKGKAAHGLSKKARLTLEQKINIVEEIENLPQNDKARLYAQLKAADLKVMPFYKTGIPEQQSWVIYAWLHTNGDKNFLYMITAESNWRHFATHQNEDGSIDSGFCQLNNKFHWDYIVDESCNIDDPNQNCLSKEFRDPYNQIRYCYNLWQDAKKKGRLSSTFYGIARIPEVRNEIEFIPIDFRKF